MKTAPRALQRVIALGRSALAFARDASAHKAMLRLISLERASLWLPDLRLAWASSLSAQFLTQTRRPHSSIVVPKVSADLALYRTVGSLQLAAAHLHPPDSLPSRRWRTSTRRFQMLLGQLSRACPQAPIPGPALRAFLAGPSHSQASLEPGAGPAVSRQRVCPFLRQLHPHHRPLPVQ